MWKYEVTMFGITLAFLVLAAFFFFVYGRMKTAPVMGAEEAELARPAGRGSVR